MELKLWKFEISPKMKLEWSGSRHWKAELPNFTEVTEQELILLDKGRKK